MGQCAVLIMQVNQRGQPVREEIIYTSWGTVHALTTTITDDMRDQAIALLCEKLKVEIVLTNATKHGDTEVVLRECPDV